ARGQVAVVEEADRPVVHAPVILAQVGDVEDQVRRVFGELALGVLERDGGEVLLRRVELAGEIFEPADLEGDLHRVLAVGKHVEIEDRKSTRLNSSHRTISY